MGVCCGTISLEVYEWQIKLKTRLFSQSAQVLSDISRLNSRTAFN